jgi:hypothetical protein
MVRLKHSESRQNDKPKPIQNYSTPTDQGVKVQAEKTVVKDTFSSASRDAINHATNQIMTKQTNKEPENETTRGLG